MKEEEQDKKQRKRLVHASLFSGFGAQTWLPNEWDGRMPSIVR